MEEAFASFPGVLEDHNLLDMSSIRKLTLRQKLLKYINETLSGKDREVDCSCQLLLC